MNIFKRIGAISLLIVTYPIFRGLSGDKYAGNGFFKDIKEAWNEYK